MSLPASNARLLKIQGGGFSEDYDQAAGADADRWSGSAGVYLVDRVLVATAPEGRDELRQTYLVVATDPGTRALVGDSLVLEQDGVEQTREVRQVEDHRIAGTVRLYLFDA